MIHYYVADPIFETNSTFEPPVDGEAKFNKNELILLLVHISIVHLRITAISLSYNQ